MKLDPRIAELDALYEASKNPPDETAGAMFQCLSALHAAWPTWLREAALELLSLKSPIPEQPRPSAWLHNRHSTAYVITDRVKEIWLAADPEHVENYTIPLYFDSGAERDRNDAAIDAAMATEKKHEG